MDSITKSILVNASPKPGIYFDGSEYLQGPQYGYYFNCVPDTFITYSWKIGSAGNYTGAHPRAYFGVSGDTERIYLTVKNKAGCVGTSDTIVIVKGLFLYLFPNSFTPNNDGINEGFGISGPEYIKTYKLWIFNRWGEVVFYTENPYEKWYPTNPIPGLYAYKSKVQDIYSRWKEVDGTVLLVR